jgi:hypothetical protein
MQIGVTVRWPRNENRAAKDGSTDSAGLSAEVSTHPVLVRTSVEVTPDMSAPQCD